MHPAWNWFKRAKKEMRSDEVDTRTDEEIRKEVEDFLKVNGKERAGNFMAVLDMIMRS